MLNMQRNKYWMRSYAHDKILKEYQRWEDVEKLNCVERLKQKAKCVGELTHMGSMHHVLYNNNVVLVAVCFDVVWDVAVCRDVLDDLLEGAVVYKKKLLWCTIWKDAWVWLLSSLSMKLKLYTYFGEYVGREARVKPSQLHKRKSKRVCWVFKLAQGWRSHKRTRCVHEDKKPQKRSCLK